MPLPERTPAFAVGPEDAEMALIRRTCDAEDAARTLLAPYNQATVTRDQVDAVHAELSELMALQLARGRHARMDFVISLRTKMDELGKRLITIAEPDVLA
ncbi:MAG TPA: hypothetical protein PKV72_04870 [Candidatus Peribacteria bacterium]|nr:hypothetical protein [Candidatus Peribacteria bacterium]